jgi:hypothetical protein
MAINCVHQFRLSQWLQATPKLRVFLSDIVQRTRLSEHRQPMDRSGGSPFTKNPAGPDFSAGQPIHRRGYEITAELKK